MDPFVLNQTMSFRSTFLEDAKDQTFLNFLRTSYEARFNDTPQFFIRCPGCINILGEDVTYNQFPVVSTQMISLAVDRDILIAVGPNPTHIDIRHIEDDYGESIRILYEDINDKLFGSAPQWYTHILAGIFQVSQYFNLDPPPTLNFLVSRSVPIGSGFSSSSALVCGAALAVSFARGLHLRENLNLERRLAIYCTQAAEYIGKEGKLTDHTIIFSALKDYAYLTDLSRRTLDPIRIPRDLYFVVAYSGIPVAKSIANMTDVFRLRIAECILAAKVLACIVRLNWADVNNLNQLKDLLSMNSHDLIELIQEHLSPVPYTSEMICTILDISHSHLARILANLINPENLMNVQFQLRLRAVHVINEEKCVIDFLRCCEIKDLEGAGEAMDRSHRSQRIYFESSHQILENLMETARNNGALGARIAGVGLGGCIVAAVTRDYEANVVYALKEYLDINGGDPDTVFSTRPCPGAKIYD